ncbi:MAG: hypothetical protein N4A44_03430 [Alphaproteobacteria bacterium]|jgi:hypothetical protein|nr:hypothetical protein [Alphaproteobacteria bacterium]
MSYLKKKYGYSFKEICSDCKNDFFIRVKDLSRDEKDSLIISSVLHFLIFILILVAPYTTNMNRLKSVKKDTVVIFDLENLKLTEKDNLPSSPVKPKVEKKKEVAKKQEPKKVEQPKKVAKKAVPATPVKTPKVEQKPSNNVKGGSVDIANNSSNKKGETKVDEKSKKLLKKADVKTGSMEDLFKSIDDIKSNVAEREIAQKKEAEKQAAVDNLLKELVEVEKLEEAPKKAFTESDNGKTVADKEVSVSYINAIKYKIKGCWNIDPGAKGIQDLSIEIDSVLTPDGSIQSVNIVDMRSYNSNPHFKAAADSARRALIDCAPYNLPMERYSIWKDIRFNFRPSRGAIE